jgi:hypothetical protein
MKKSCYIGKERYCLALEAWRSYPKCSLGFSIACDYDKQSCIYRNPRPLEKCPKPKTYAQLIAVRDKRHNEPKEIS